MRRDDVAVHAARFVGKPFDERRAVSHFAARFRQRLALFDGQDRGEVVDIGHAQVEPAAQDGAAFLGRFRAPSRERGLGGCDGAARFGGAQLRHGAEHAAVGGIVHGKDGAIVGVNPLAGDVALLAEEALVLDGQDGFGFGDLSFGDHAV